MRVRCNRLWLYCRAQPRGNGSVCLRHSAPSRAGRIGRWWIAAPLDLGAVRTGYCRNVGAGLELVAGGAFVVAIIISLVLLRAGVLGTDRQLLISFLATLTIYETESNSFWVEIENRGQVDSGITKVGGLVAGNQ